MVIINTNNIKIMNNKLYILKQKIAINKKDNIEKIYYTYIEI